MKKILFSLVLVGLLSGCTYDAATGCWGVFQNGYCPDGISDFDSYYKDGETKEQKTQDVSDCGGEMDSEGYIFYYIRKNVEQSMKNEDSDKVFNAKIDAVRKFDLCMKSKGYKFDSERRIDPDKSINK